MFSFHAKNTPKQGCFCYFIRNLTPKQIWAQMFKSALTKTTPFCWKWTFSDPQDLKKKTSFSSFFLKKSIFRPLNTKRVLRVVLKKDPLVRVFCSGMSTPIYLSAPPPRNKDGVSCARGDVKAWRCAHTSWQFLFTSWFVQGVCFWNARNISYSSKKLLDSAVVHSSKSKDQSFGFVIDKHWCHPVYTHPDTSDQLCRSHIMLCGYTENIWKHSPYIPCYLSW